VVSKANRIKPEAPKRRGSCLTASYADAELAVAGVMTEADVSLLVKQRKLKLPLPGREQLAEALSASGVDCLRSSTALTTH
jgi:hypothetical protein